MTPKQRQRAAKNAQLVIFRRWLRFEGNGGKIREYVGLNVWELREHLESQWQPGMTWENYGKEWVVDHIVALKYFDAFDENDMRLCWTYHNLQPCWYLDNHAKGYCVEVTTKVLNSMKKSASSQMLIEKVARVKDMFEPYYSK